MIGKTARAAGAVTAALLAAGALGGCASTGSGGSANALGSGSGAASPGPVLTLPVVPVGANGTVTAGSVNGTGGSGGSVGTTAPVNAAPAGGAAATQTGVPQCSTTDLSPEADIVAGSAASGHIAMNITVTNDSGHTCYIDGFPGLALEDKNQDQQPTAVNWDASVAKTMITLTDGKSASSSAHLDKDLPGAGEPLTGPCEAASFYLQITPPNNTTQLVAPIGDTGGAGITVCDSGALDVLAFVPGSVGPQQ